jgi:two-component system, cell cycle sensor histidine kinase and response regulator CckA
VLEVKGDAPSLVVEGNASQLRQILVNLVTNAWESCDGRGGVHISTKAVAAVDIPASHRFPIGWQPHDSVYACLEVVDTGCGIPEKDIEKLFDPFFSHKSSGRGLGLPVVLGIVRAHNGAVTVASAPGRGSAFRVFLPLSAEPLRQRTKLQLVPKPMGGGTALLVEDEPTVRRVVARMLSRLGFTVLQAGDGVEALEIFQQNQDDVRCVLCDLTMPRKNGWETLAALRKLAPALPVILASGFDEGQAMAGDHAELPQAFLSKPYRLKSLRAALGQALQGGAGSQPGTD